ncbi:hypothetical protein [Nonomuraea sp. NPDC050310]|uniref:amidohydrolase family protein n=1 Tax=Nonomuraea sp. NPDC050310 TaxID=3154935 RepID=UPI0033F98D14
MPTGQALSTRLPVVLHSAPLVAPMESEPVRGGAVAVRGDRVLRVGPRRELLSRYEVAEEIHWRGLIVPGLVDAFATAPVTGVTTRAGLSGPDLRYLDVRCPSEQAWEEHERDALITAIREAEQPVGVAAHSPDPAVQEDLAILARTFGLRLLADLERHPLEALDDAGILGPHCHVACSGRLGPGERKLLRLRRVVPAFHGDGDPLPLFDDGEPVALSLPLAGTLRRARPTQAGRLVEALTLVPARALGLGHGPGRVGSLGPGSRADLAVFDARGRHPYSALLDQAPCLGTVRGGLAGAGTLPGDLVPGKRRRGPRDVRGPDGMHREAEAGRADPRR